jgi:glycine/D-amino acid oxidase-like deaminating enzyme
VKSNKSDAVIIGGGVIGASIAFQLACRKIKVKLLEKRYPAAGHEGDGIALSPYTGELIAQLVVDGKANIPLCDFSLERF